MHRGAVYILGISVTVIAILAYGVFQPRDSDLHISYYESTFVSPDGGETKVHAHAFHSYSGGDETVRDVDCSLEQAGNANPHMQGHTAPVSCSRSQWFTLFGFLFAVFAWVPTILAQRDTDGGKTMYKLAYLMFLFAVVSLWFGYEHALAMADHKDGAGQITSVEVDHTLPVLLLCVTLFSMLFVVGPLARLASTTLDKAADAVEIVTDSETKFARLDV